jgi:PAS domain S-box-containing protein
MDMKTTDKQQAATKFIAPDFEALIEAAGDLIYSIDIEGRYTWCNQAAIRVFGYDPEELMGKPFGSILTPASAALAYRHFSEALAGKDISPLFEVEGVRQDGTIVHLEVRAGNLFRDGVIVGRQGIARDINEVKALQAQVTEKSQRMTLLEDRTRIVMSMYARLAEMVSDTGTLGSGDETLKEIHSTLHRISADKLGLSALDVKILGMLAKGHSNDEIAALTYRSPHTVKGYVKKIMQRLGAKRRAEAAACAIRLGLVKDE